MARPKVLTRAQLESRKEKAERFTRDVLGGADRADEIARGSIEDYAETRKIQLSNPTERRNATMARRLSSREAALKDRITELEEENEDLQSRLDDIADILNPEEDEKEEEN